MGTVYHKTATKPLPDGAEIYTRNGKRFARWKNRRTGKAKTSPVAVASDGKYRIVVTARTYTAKFRDGSRVVREVSTGCRDETAARRVLADFERRAELVKAGVITASEDTVADHLQTPLAGHLDAYLLTLEAEETSPKHRKNVRRCLDRLTADCAFKRLADLCRESQERWMVSLRKAGMGARTRNTYRAATVAFANWCVRSRRLTSNPFASVAKANEAADTRRQRRSLTENELCRLLYVARLRPLAEYGRATVRRDAEDQPDSKRSRRTWQRVPLTLDNIDDATGRARERLAGNQDFLAELIERGWERALLYKTAVLTGLRRGELASLTVASLDLDADPPCLTLDAADEKSREGNTLPLRADLAAELRDWLASKADALQDAARRAPTVKLDRAAAKPGKRDKRASGGRQAQSCRQVTAPDTLVFYVPQQMYSRLNVDLRAAGIPKVDDRGWTVDFHALRHTFGSLLSATGTAPGTAQAAMRHSDIDLTMNVYTDPRLLDVSGAIDRLPDLPLDGSLSRTERETEAATGTDGKPDSPARQFAPGFAPNSDNSGANRSLPDKTTDGDADPRNAKTTEKTSVSPMVSQERVRGLEPPTYSLGSCHSAN